MAIRLGLGAKLYRNAAASGTPSWVLISNVRDLTLNLETGEADVTTRGNNGWRATMATLKDASLEFEMVWDTEDVNFTVIRNAFLGNQSIRLAALDDFMGDGQGIYARWMITGFSRNEPLEEAVTVSVTAKPTYSAKQNKSLVVWLFKIAVATVGAGAALVALGTTISGIGAAMGMAATVATGIGTAIATLGSVLASILTPIGLVIAGVVGLAGYLLYASGVGGKALTWLSSMFMNLKSTALAAFQGITDALAAGDMALAAKILWLTLKMEWQRGVGWLQEKWIGFKEYFLSVWTDAVYGLSKIMTGAWAGLQSIWTETVAAMSTAWTVFSSGAVSAWKGAQNFIAKGIVRLMGMLDDSVDVEGTLNILQEDFERDERSRQKTTQAQLQNIETGRQRRQSDIESQRTGTIDNLEQDRQRAQNEQKRRLSGDLKQSEEALAAARREWEEALAEAAAKRIDAQAGQGPESIKRAELELDGLDDVIDSTRQKVDVVGTFNPLAAVSLSSDSLGERTAKASEQVAANTKRLVQEAQLGGLVFS